MKISELIEKLSILKQEFGDIPVIRGKRDDKHLFINQVYSNMKGNTEGDKSYWIELS